MLHTSPIGAAQAWGLGLWAQGGSTWPTVQSITPMDLLSSLQSKGVKRYLLSRSTSLTVVYLIGKCNKKGKRDSVLVVMRNILLGTIAKTRY